MEGDGSENLKSYSGIPEAVFVVSFDSFMLHSCFLLKIKEADYIYFVSHLSSIFF